VFTPPASKAKESRMKITPMFFVKMMIGVDAEVRAVLDMTTRRESVSDRNEETFMRPSRMSNMRLSTILKAPIATDNNRKSTNDIGERWDSEASCRVSDMVEQQPVVDDESIPDEHVDCECRSPIFPFCLPFSFVHSFFFLTFFQLYLYTFSLDILLFSLSFELI
jgi:hypothetical protein